MVSGNLRFQGRRVSSRVFRSTIFALTFISCAATGCEGNRSEEGRNITGRSIRELCTWRDSRLFWRQSLPIVFQRGESLVLYCDYIVSHDVAKFKFFQSIVASTKIYVFLLVSKSFIVLDWNLNSSIMRARCILISIGTQSFVSSHQERNNSLNLCFYLW